MKKETDVNIALAMLDLDYKDKFDHAFLISNDSDLAPAIHMVEAQKKQKQFYSGKKKPNHQRLGQY